MEEEILKEKRTEFLYNAIADAQELVRFIDTKTAIVITILGSYLIGFFVSIDKIFLYSQYYSCGFWFFFVTFLLLLASCIIITTRIIKPTNNPDDNINLGSLTKPDLKFFLASNIHCPSFMFHNSKTCKLNENFETYLQLLNTSNQDSIIKTLTFELFKVSFIRNVKNERFNWLLRFLVATTLVFSIAYGFYSSETQDAFEIVEMLKKYQK